MWRYDGIPRIKRFEPAERPGKLRASDNPEEFVAKYLNFIIEKCTGCHQCELACSAVHAGVFNQDLSRIRIFQLHDESKNVPYACIQCEEAWCLHACPVEAIYESTETGAKVLVDSLCVGCKVCTIACPYGTVVYHPSSGKVVKCDLCEGHDDGPYCVASCPTAAIELVEVPAA